MDSAPAEADLSAYADEVAAMVGVAIPAFCRRGVMDNLAVLRRHAKLLLEFPLSAEIDVPVVFRP